MIIEFFGPPGAGKTTIAQALCKTDEMVLVTISNRRERYRYSLSYLFNHPVRFCCLVLNIARQSFPSARLFWYKFHRFSYQVATTTKAVYHSNQGDLIIDDGLAQHFLSLYERPVSPKAIKKYFSHYPMADLFVLVTAPEELRLERMRERGRIPRSHTRFNWRRWLGAVAANTDVAKQNNILSSDRLLILDTGEKSLALTIKELHDKICQNQ